MGQKVIHTRTTMRALVILVAATCCSAQLVLPYTAPWVLPQAKLITTPEVEGELKTVSLASPYLHPFGHPLLASPYSKLITTSEDDDLKAVPLASPYLHPFGYPWPGSPYTYPYVVKAEAESEEEAPAVEKSRRRRRDVQVPLPYLHAVPTVAKTTVETKQFEPIDAATPADTTKIELTTKEHEISVPAVKYVQPVVNYKPMTYKTVSHPFLPYSHGLTYTHPLTYSHGLPFNYGFPYGPFLGASVVKVDEE